MLKRKFDLELAEWEKSGSSNVLVVEGIRQCGKTMTVRRFAEKNYGKVLWLDFRGDPRAKEVAGATGSVSYMNLLLTAGYGVNLEEDGILILDQLDVVDPKALAQLLSIYRKDGHYPLIAITGKNQVDPEEMQRLGIPVKTMWPLDFEEFLWAAGAEENTGETLRECLQEKKPVPDKLHQFMEQTLFRYITVGGFPAAVEAYLKSEAYQDAHAVLQQMRDSVQQDFEARFTRIRSKNMMLVMDSIPVHLAEDYKKFQFNKVGGNGSGSRFEQDVVEAEKLGYLYRCFNLKEPWIREDTIQSGNYMALLSDIGWYMASIPAYFSEKALCRDFSGRDHAILQSLFADFLAKAGKSMYYYRRRSGMTIDLVLPGEQGSVVVEFLHKGNDKAARTILMEEPERVEKGIIFGSWNIEEKERMLCLPWYMGYFLLT